MSTIMTDAIVDPLSALLAQRIRREREARGWSIAVLAPLLRLGIIPIAFIAAAWFLPLTVELKRILVIQGAMPSAVFSIMVAKLYGGHPATAVQCVLSTTLVSIITTPLVIAWAIKAMAL